LLRSLGYYFQYLIINFQFPRGFDGKYDYKVTVHPNS
jgi:hypothetical protein